MDEFAGIQWDEGNSAKCQKHGVSLAEIEAFFLSDDAPIVFPDPAPVEPRYRAIGPSLSGRHLFVVFTVRTVEDETYIRPISARYMHQKEIEYYEEAVPPPLKDR